MDLFANRVHLTPATPPVARAGLEVAVLGHCPVSPTLDRLDRRGDVVFDELRRVGYGFVVERLLADPDDPVRELYHVPVPLHSSAEFDDLYPGVRQADTAYRSTLAGRHAWLPQCVDDFFANGGQKLWVIRVPEDDGEAAFLPPSVSNLHEPQSLRGIAVPLVLDEVGVIAMPDLERLRIPATLPDVPNVRLAKPEPRFIPCSAAADTRRLTGQPRQAEPERQSFRLLLERIGTTLATHRPDMVCLFTLPLGHESRLGRPVADAAALADLEDLRSTTSGTSDTQLPGSLRRIQFLFPYLRGQRHKLVSTVGIVAGLQAKVAAAEGPWRSVAGLPMVTDSKPYPAVNTFEATRLRETPGVGVIGHRSPLTTLDDERLAVPALHPLDYAGSASSMQKFNSYRSGEIARFLGYLLRTLTRLGESLVFNVDAADPRPELALEEFFRGLHQAGALRGDLPEDAFRIERRFPQADAVLFDIEIAPAFPIDRLRLTFVNRSGSWAAEVNRV